MPRPGRLWLLAAGLSLLLIGLVWPAGPAARPGHRVLRGAFHHPRARLILSGPLIPRRAEFGAEPQPQPPASGALAPSARLAAMALAPEPTSPKLLLPDLETLAPHDLHIQKHWSGRRFLRLANTVWNSGEGPLELLGQYDRASRQRLVSQIIYAADGSEVSLLAGAFIWHPQHQHWHFDNFAVYELLALTPEGETVVAGGSKVSFCTLETDAVGIWIEGFSHRRVYSACGQERQGLSVGWGDTYEAHLAGQTIDITGLPDGRYLLRSTADPDNLLRESDDSNNTAEIYLEIRGNQVRPVAGPPACRRAC